MALFAVAADSGAAAGEEGEAAEGEGAGFGDGNSAGLNGNVGGGFVGAGVDLEVGAIPGGLEPAVVVIAKSAELEADIVGGGEVGGGHAVGFKGGEILTRVERSSAVDGCAGTKFFDGCIGNCCMSCN